MNLLRMIACSVLLFSIFPQGCARLPSTTPAPEPGPPATAGKEKAAEESADSGVPAVVREMNRELLKKSSDPGGRPLPVVSHWANGFGDTNFSSIYQVGMLEKGHHIMPTLPLPQAGAANYDPKGKETVMKLAAWKAPISLRAGQWEEILYSKAHPADQPGRWRNLPPEKSPFLISPEGKDDFMLSPIGEIGPWKEAGLCTTSSASFNELESWYPDPPLVIFLSNNESSHLKFKHDIEKREKRYLEKYGSGTSPWKQRSVIAEGYVERYAALLEGMSEGLASEHWRRHCLFVGYEAFGPSHFGRWGGWASHSLATEERIDPWHLAWAGCSPSYYTHDWDASTDYRVWSPQIEAMNWIFMLDEVRRERPEFWFELSVWDGNFGTSKSYQGKKSKVDSYREKGQEWSPERYAGFVQYGLWLTTPRVLREFRLSSAYRSDFEKDFEALVATVDRIWNDPLLTKFWRHGQLVANRSRQHPYQSEIPEKWRSADRWFMLDTSLDSKEKWNLKTEIPVFSLARVIGEKGSREWLVYAHSPLRQHDNVGIDVPDYGRITVNVRPAGAFYHVSESARSVTPVAEK